MRSLPFTQRTHSVVAPPFPAVLLRPLLSAAGVCGEWALAFKALALFAFCSFARLSSLVPPSADLFDSSRFPVLRDLWVQGGVAYLRIKYSKTRQAAGGGFVVPLVRSSVLPCPVAMAEALLARAAVRRAPPTSPLFACWRGVGTQPLSLSQRAARSFLALTLKALGQPPSQFTFHSFRRGGCTHAFAGGALESDLALHGDWSSDAIRRYYPRSLAQLRVADILASTPLNLPTT